MSPSTIETPSNIRPIDSAGVARLRRIHIRRPERVAAAVLFVAAICFTVGVAVHIQAAGYTAIPYWDLWDELKPVQDAFAGRLGLGELWAQHNEHRILLDRLQIIADYELFGGRLIFLLAMILMSSTALAVALTWPFASVWRDPTVTVGFFAFSLAATLSPQALENLSWPIQVLVPQVFLFAVTAIALTVCWLRAERDSQGRVHLVALAAIVGLGGAATYSMANGLVVWPILVAVMLLRHIGRRSVSVVAVAGAAFIASYLWRYKPAVGVTPYSESFRHPLGVARYVAAFLGHPAVGLGSKTEQMVGALGVVLFVGLLILAVRDRRLLGDRAILFAASTGAFGLVTAIQTALGRLDFGLHQAVEGRYWVAVSVFWCGLAVGVASLVERRVEIVVRSKSRAMDITGLAFVSLCIGLAFEVNVAAYPSEEVLNAIQTRSEPMLVAFVSGVVDDDASLVTHPLVDRSLSGLTWLRSEGLGPWSAGLGNALEAAQRRIRRPGSLPACSGSIDSTTPVHGGQRYNGWIAAPPRRSALHEFDVVDTSGSPTGVGLVDGYRPDVKVAGGSASDFSGFVAYGRDGRPAANLILFSAHSNAPLCALRLDQS